MIEIKWKNGFQWGNGESHAGRTYDHRRCKQCGCDESVTANTLFHGMKMPVLKIFYMIFRITTKKKGMSTIELGT